MKQILFLAAMALVIAVSGCVAHAPRVCSSQGYDKDSAEYKSCIKAKQRENYSSGSGIGGGGP